MIEFGKTTLSGSFNRISSLPQALFLSRLFQSLPKLNIDSVSQSADALKSSCKLALK
jgi:hypothetical protein